MPGQSRKRDEVNENWEAEIAAYDEDCKKREREFREHFMVITEAGHASLTDEENEVLRLYLNGITCEEIAKQNQIEVEVVAGLLEIIRAKLSMVK